MSESEQDALLEKIESRRRWRVIRSRAVVALLCLAAVAIGSAVLFAH
ncbi:MAG: hypothetical protein K8F92_17545 [Hyphomicrobium sp.]|nr:hypothetical protein [Hyphomicrobium sp.]MBZ0211432.1 hypothetical protein [Hyphomicrobium sp.]